MQGGERERERERKRENRIEEWGYIGVHGKEDEISVTVTTKTTFLLNCPSCIYYIVTLAAVDMSVTKLYIYTLIQIILTATSYHVTIRLHE